MKNPLRKRVLRDLRHNMIRYLAIALVFMMVSVVIGGWMVSSNGCMRGLDQGIKDSIREDGNFSVKQEVPDQVINKIEELGITVTPQNYYEYEYDRLFTLRIFENRTKFNLPLLHEGTLPEGSNEIAIDHLYAQKNNLKIGNTFDVSGKAFQIVGLVWVPDYTSLYKNNTDMMMDAVHFGVALVSHSDFGDFSSEKITKGYAYRFRNRDLTEDEKFDVSSDVKKELIDSKVPLGSFLTADENKALSLIYQDFGSDVPMMKGFLFVMLAILAFIFVIILNHTITAEAAAIGALSAVGMRRRELLWHYLFLPASVTLLSGMFGNVICNTISYKLFDRMYHSSYSLPPFQVQFDPEVTIYTTILPIAIMLMINISFLIKQLSIMPICFLRGELKKGKSKRGMRLPDIRFINRFRLRSVLANKGSYAMLFLGIFLANTIMMLGLVLKPSIDGYIDKMEAEAVSQYQYILKAPVDPAGQQENAEKFSIRAAEYYDAELKQDFEVSILGLSEGSKYFSDIELSLNGVIVSDMLWKKYKLKQGDKLVLTDSTTNKDYRLEVRGSYPYAAGYAVFMPLDQMNSMTEKPDDYWNGWFSNRKLTFDDNKVAVVITPEILRGSGEQMLTMFSMIFNVCILAAAVIYFVLFVLLTKLVVDKNAHNISLLKVFGYRNKEIRHIFINTTSIMIALSILISLPLTKIGIELMYQAMFRKVGGYLDVMFPWWVYISVIMIGYFVYLIVNILNIKRIKNIPMEQALKVRE